MRPIDVLRMAAPAASGGGGGGGGGGATVTLSNRTISKTTNDGSIATARITISSDRNVYNQAGTLLQTWLSAGDPAGYEVKATQTGGTYNGTGDSAVGSWLNLGTARSWSESALNIGDSNSVTFSVSIREAVSHTVRATATITLTATCNDTGGTGGGTIGGQIP